MYQWKCWWKLLSRFHSIIFIGWINAEFTHPTSQTLLGCVLINKVSDDLWEKRSRIGAAGRTQKHEADLGSLVLQIFINVSKTTMCDTWAGKRRRDVCFGFKYRELIPGRRREALRQTPQRCLVPIRPQCPAPLAVSDAYSDTLPCLYSIYVLYYISVTKYVLFLQDHMCIISVSTSIRPGTWHQWTKIAFLVKFRCISN